MFTLMISVADSSSYELQPKVDIKCKNMLYCKSAFLHEVIPVVQYMRKYFFITYFYASWYTDILCIKPNTGNTVMAENPILRSESPNPASLELQCDRLLK